MMMMMVVMITMMVMKEGRGRGQKGRGLSEGRGLRDGFEEGGEKGGGVKRGEGFERGNSPFSIPTLSSNTPKKIISLTPFFCFFFFFFLSCRVSPAFCFIRRCGFDFLLLLFIFQLSRQLVPTLFKKKEGFVE